MRLSYTSLRSIGSNELLPCNLYFCKCIEYLNPNKKVDIKFYKECHRQNIQENNVNNIKITWEKLLIQNKLIMVQQHSHPKVSIHGKCL